MSNDDTTESDEESEERVADSGRPRGIRVGLGLQPLTDLLGAIIELQISEPPPTEDVTSRAELDNTRRTRRQPVGNERRKRRSDESAADQCRIDTRHDGDELTIVADLPGATRDDITVGIKPKTNELVIGRDGTVVGRVPVPWQSPEATRIWFNNGILEVRLRPSDA